MTAQIMAKMEELNDRAEISRSVTSALQERAVPESPLPQAWADVGEVRTGMQRLRSDQKIYDSSSSDVQATIWSFGRWVGKHWEAIHYLFLADFAHSDEEVASPSRSSLGSSRLSVLSSPSRRGSAMRFPSSPVFKYPNDALSNPGATSSTNHVSPTSGQMPRTPATPSTPGTGFRSRGNFPASPGNASMGSPGNKRLSNVAGAGASAGRRGSSAPRPVNQNFMDSLRGSSAAGASAASFKPEKRLSSGRKSGQASEVSARTFVDTVNMLGFTEGAELIFDQISNEGAHWERSFEATPETITYSQLLKFERRPGLVLASIAEMLSLKRGSVLKAWRLDFDMEGCCTATKSDFIKACSALGCEDQARQIWDCYLRPLPHTQGSALEFKDLEPHEFQNASDFCRLAMSAGDEDPDEAWAIVAAGEEDTVDLERFRDAASQLSFKGQTRCLFDALDISNQGRFWREDFDYLLKLTLPHLRKAAEVAHDQIGMAMSPVTIQPWMPSEHEDVARDFGYWAVGHWDSLHELFEGKARHGASVVDLERWLHMLAYHGDVIGVFSEISRERPFSGIYDSMVVVLSQLKAFRSRRNTIARAEFLDLLRWRRGNVLRSWKLDFDVGGQGLVGQTDFMRAARRVGAGDEILLVWDHAHKDGGNDALSLRDISQEELSLLERFARALLDKFDWDVQAAWVFLDADQDDALTLHEFMIGVESIDFVGDVELLFNGLTSSAHSYLWPEDWDYFWTLALLHMRLTWCEPPIFSSGVDPAHRDDGSMQLLGRLALDRRGLDAKGEKVTLARLCAELRRLGFHNNAMRAAADLVWKMLSGDDCNLHASAKGVCRPPDASAGAKEKAQWDTSTATWYSTKWHPSYGSPCYKKVFDGDAKSEQRRRLVQFHSRTLKAQDVSIARKDRRIFGNTVRSSSVS